MVFLFILRVRLLDQENVQQQEALGILGVNLIFGAFYLHLDPVTLITSLMANLNPERVEVDTTSFPGRTSRASLTG